MRLSKTILPLLVALAPIPTAFAGTPSPTSKITPRYTRRLISKTVRQLTGWEKVKVRLGQPSPYLAHKQRYIVTPINRGTSDLTASMVLGDVNVAKGERATRHGPDRLYNFITPSFLNGHSYRPIGTVLKKLEQAPRE